jgi:hypothetical protein
MRHSRRIAGLALLALVLSLFAFTLTEHKWQTKSFVGHSTEGDLVFRQGKGLWSPFFATLSTQTGFSHVGVLVRENQEWFVIHSEADDVSLEGGVQITPLEKFIDESSQYEFRQNAMTGPVKQQFIAELRSMLVSRTQFDLDFRIDDDGDKVYCTEFVWLAAKKAGASDLGQVISVAGRELILVDSIYQSKWLH